MTSTTSSPLRATGLTGALGAIGLLIASAGAAQADSISSVENARAKERAGYYTSGQDREKLRRYGRNDDYSYGSYRDDYYGPSAGVSLYVGPRSYGGDYYDD